MEQNLASDEELLKRISDALKDSDESRPVEEQLDNSSAEKFHDVSESIDSSQVNDSSAASFSARKDLELENQILASQFEAERRKARELQSKLELFKNSKYFAKLNCESGQTVEAQNSVTNYQGDFDAMQKLRPKTVHTAVRGNLTGGQESADDGAAISSEPQTEKEAPKPKKQETPNNEVAFRDAEDFRQLEENLAIVKDRGGSNDNETEKVFITKTEKKWFEDIGNLASRIRTPLDDKHQKFYEKDRKRFVNRIVMPETQEVDKAESIPADLISRAKETPVNLTSTELDGLRSYLLQLKELIARRETAWARTTEREYSQRVEITRFKNEVSHLRMLCEKRQKDIKERDQIILAKDEEIKDLQKRVQSLKNAMLKMERRDSRALDGLDDLTAEVLENSQLVQKSFSVMKRATLLNKGIANTPRAGSSSVRCTSSGKEISPKRTKLSHERAARKIKSTSSNSNDEDVKPKSKTRASHEEKAQKSKQRSESSHPPTRRKKSLERVDEKLQRIEEMLHSDVLKSNRKQSKASDRKGAFSLLTASDPTFQKFATSNGKIRQEMLSAMVGLSASGSGNSSRGPTPPKQGSLYDPKNQGNAAILANVLLAARNTNTFNL